MRSASSFGTNTGTTAYRIKNSKKGRAQKEVFTSSCAFPPAIRLGLVAYAALALSISTWIAWRRTSVAAWMSSGRSFSGIGLPTTTVAP